MKRGCKVMNKYTCLIVEDSNIEREGLRYLLELRGYQLQILEASNGEEALEILKSRNVHILITDIRMPFVDGLELAQMVSENNPDIKIVICSAYGEFLYAKRAIDYHVRGYLLKPVRRTEFYELIDKIIEELEKEMSRPDLTKLEIEKCWYDIMHGCKLDETMRIRLQRHGIEIDSIHPILMVIKFESNVLKEGGKILEKIIGSRADGLWVLDMERAMLVINEEKSKEDLLKTVSEFQALLENGIGVKPAILFVQPRGEISELRNIWQCMETQSEFRLLKSGLICEMNGLNAAEEAEFIEQMNRLLIEARAALEKQNDDEAYAYIEEFCSYIRMFGNASALYMRYVTMEAIAAVTQSGCTRKLLKEMLNQVIDARSVGEMAEFVGEFKNKLSPKSELKEEDAIERILKIIHGNYMDELTLETLAKRVYLSPPYLSYLFKKRTGTTLIKYLTDCRMKHAAEILLNENRTITEVAQMVGYDNVSYFSSLFKTRFGIPPTQYGKVDKSDRGV